MVMSLPYPPPGLHSAGCFLCGWGGEGKRGGGCRCTVLKEEQHVGLSRHLFSQVRSHHVIKSGAWRP